jgi:hypothetical protein
MRISAIDRYQRDPEFNQLVNLIRHHLEENDFTPTELREACMVAATIFEMEYVRPVVLPDGRIMEYVGPKSKVAVDLKEKDLDRRIEIELRSLGLEKEQTHLYHNKFCRDLVARLISLESQLNNREPPKYEFNHHHLSQIFMNSSVLTSTLCDNMARQAIEYVEEIIYGK